MESINNTINDSYNMPWNHTQTNSFTYQQGVSQIPPEIYPQNNGNIDHRDTDPSFNYTNYASNYSHENELTDSMSLRVIPNDQILPPIPTPSHHTLNRNNNYYSHNNFNGYYNNNITMPYINDDSNSNSSSSHYSPKQSPNIIPKQNNNIKSNTIPPTHMDNMIKMNEMMKEMKQSMTEMMMITNVNCMNNMKAMLNKCQSKYKSNNNTQSIHAPPINAPPINAPPINAPPINNFEARYSPEKHYISCDNIDNSSVFETNLINIDDIASIESKPFHNNNINTKKRTLTESIEDNNTTDILSNYNEEIYPEIGLRATTTISLSKNLFTGNNKYHFDISREILLRAIKRITEYRWIHSKYNINTNDIKYLLFISENINYLPKEFQTNKPKRGRPPKNKKQKLDLNKQNKSMTEHNNNISNDKIYRLNFQIVFDSNIKQSIKSEIIKCIKIDLNENSFTQLLTNVINENVIVTNKIQCYSLYAVNAKKLTQYEKYEKEEDLRKKKKREREQKRRENKKTNVAKNQ